MKISFLRQISKVKVVNQPLLKLTGRLKDKSSKIISIPISSEEIHKTKRCKYDIKSLNTKGGKNAGVLEHVQNQEIICLK